MAPAAKKSVDDIWKALNTGSKSNKVNNVLAVMNKDNSKVEGRANKSTKSKQVCGNEECAAENRPETSTDGPSAESVLNGFDGQAYESLRQTLQRDLNCLLEKSARTRQKALERIHAVANASFELLPQELLGEATSGLFCKPLLRRFEDPVEKCRDLAILTLHRLVERADVSQELLPYVIPVLSERLAALEEGKAEFVEPSEEIRFKLVSFLRLLISSCESSVAPYGQDISEMLIAISLDTCPEVLEVLCECGRMLGGFLGRRLEPLARKLIFAFTPCFEHKRTKVRCAVIRAIRALMHCGCHETILDLSSFQHPNIVQVKAFYGEYQKVNWFGKMAMDSSAAVREEFVHMHSDWVCTLWERLDHETRLIPYVIGGLTDEAPRVQKAALKGLQAAGDLFEEEKKEDLKDVKYYGQDFLAGLEAQYLDGAYSYLPEVLEGNRPTLGCRRVVSDNCHRLLYPMLKELEAWQSDNKVAAAKLFYMCLVYSEAGLNRELHRIIPTMVKVIQDEEIKSMVLRSCKVLGRFADPQYYMEIILERLHPTLDNNGRTGVLYVLEQLARGAAIGSLNSHLPRLLQIFMGDDILKSHHVALKDQTLAVLDALLLVCPEVCRQYTRDCVIILTNLATPALNKSQAPGFLPKVWDTLEVMASSEAMSVADLISVFRPKMIHSLLSNVKAWTAFETEHLLCLTSSTGMHPPSKEEVAEITSVLRAVLPVLSSTTQVRLLKSMECMARASEELDVKVARRLMHVLNERLHLRASDVPVANAAEGIYPALDGARNILTRRLLPEVVVKGQVKSWSKRWAEVLGLVDADMELRDHACDLISTAIKAYGDLILRGSTGVMLCEAVLARLHDSYETVRLSAIRVISQIFDYAKSATSSSKRIMSKLAATLSLPTLANESSADFKAELATLQAELEEYGGIAADPDDDDDDDDDDDESDVESARGDDSDDDNDHDDVDDRGERDAERDVGDVSCSPDMTSPSKPTGDAKVLENTAALDEHQSSLPASEPSSKNAAKVKDGKDEDGEWIVDLD